MSSSTLTVHIPYHIPFTMTVKELQSDIGTTVLKHHQLDISCSSSIATFKNHIESNYGGFDVLVNNAGIVLGLGPPTSGVSSNKGMVHWFIQIQLNFNCNIICHDLCIGRPRQS